jgi:dihydroorotate dehydrogenase
MEVLRHEGLKHGIETMLAILSSNPLGRAALRLYAGEIPEDPRLETTVGTIDLRGPVGLGAGWDKTGKTLSAWQILGARYVIPGGVNFYGQAGNPMPRLRTFDRRVGDGGSRVTLNSMGFNSRPVGEFVDNIARQRESGNLTIPVIPQVTVNKEFYEPGMRQAIPNMLAKTVKKVLPVADGISLGLTSPNTLGMRDAQAYDFWKSILETVREEMPGNMPVEIKGDGDGGEERLDMYSRLAAAGMYDIISLINSTALEDIKDKYGAAHLPGGLAGADSEYRRIAVRVVSHVYENVGDTVDIIGLGGVNNGRTAMTLIEAGASAIGVVSSPRQKGLHVIRNIERDMIGIMDTDHEGKSIPQIVGISTSRGPKLRKSA